MATQDSNEPAYGSDAHKASTLQSLLDGTIADIVSQAKRVPQDLGIVFSIAKTELTNGIIDDKKYLVSSNGGKLNKTTRS